MRSFVEKTILVGVLIGSLFASGYPQSGYWKYDSYQIVPTAEQLAAIKPMPGRVFEQRATGGVQTGPGSGKGSLELFFKTDNVDRVVHLATMTATFSSDASLVTLVPLQKVGLEMSVSVVANDKARAVGTIGSGTIAIDNGEYLVSVSAKPDQVSSGKGMATIPGGGPGSNMIIDLGSYLAQYGALGAHLRMVYVWVEGTPPPASKNMALNQPTKQSSNSRWSKPNDAQGAVDGVKNRSYGFHTNREKDPWWQVDLGAVKQLTEIRIFNRLECCADRARTIQVLLSDDGTRWNRIYAHNGTIFGERDGKPLSIDIKGNAARYVRLQLAETNWFHLDEVEIY